MEETNKGKSSKIKIGGILLAVFLVIYIPSFFHWAYGMSIATDVLSRGVIEFSTNTDAYIVRDEEVLNAPFDGSYIPQAVEGEKVPVNHTVATIIRQASKQLFEDLRKKDLQIIEAQKQKMKNDSFFSDDITKLDADIDGKLKQVINLSNNNSLEKLGQLKDEVNSLIRKKAEIVGKSSVSDSHIRRLQREKDEMQQILKQSTREISVRSSGIVSYFIDGYEKILNPANIRAFTPKLLESVKANKMVDTYNDKDIELHKPFVKLIKDANYYLVAVLPPERTEGYNPGDVVDVRLSSIESIIRGVIDYKSDPMEGKCILSVKVDRALADTAPMRTVNIDLIKKRYEGYKVPVTSLFNYEDAEDTADLLLVRAKCATKRRVRVIAKDADFAIIEAVDKAPKKGINLYDIYILKPENIQEGQLIER